MPGMTFAPDKERHLTLAALGHCLQHYGYLREQAAGLRAPGVPGKSLLIGIGLDAGVGALWQQFQRHGHWEADFGVQVAREQLEAEHPGLALPDVRLEIEAGIRGYAEQWADGVRGWEVIDVHPYLDPAEHARLTLRLPDGRQYLCMPDMEVRAGGVLTVVDQKTSAFGYRAEDWAWEPQLLMNSYALAQRTGEPVQYLVDFMQRPSRYKKGAGVPTWTFPPTEPFPMTLARMQQADGWLRLAGHRLGLLEQMPADPAVLRDPAACRTWYGRCEFWETCWGEGAPEGEAT